VQELFLFTAMSKQFQVPSSLQLGTGGLFPVLQQPEFVVHH
jgi:hypothetical protein